MRKYNVSGPINQLGYGIACTNIVCEMVGQGGDIALFPISPIRPDDCPIDKLALIREAEKRAGLYALPAPSLRIYHQNRLAEFPGRGKRVGFPFFELADLTGEERHHMNNCDEIVVASRWAAKVCENNEITVPVTVAPLGVDRIIFDDSLRTRLTRTDIDHTVFVNVGKWEIRKGHDILVNAFNKAFSPHDKVMLKMIPENPFIGHQNEMWQKRYLGSKMGATNKIAIYPRFNTQSEVAQFLASSDCGVFPARAEGWNLELIECLSLGLPCIATNYSAHTEFITDKNCRLISVDDMEPAYDGVWFLGQGRWARLEEAQEEQLVEHLRTVHRAKQSGSLPLNVEGMATAKAFTWSRTATTLLGVLDR